MLTTHFDLKILPQIGPRACGGEVNEGKHLGRTIRWSLKVSNGSRGLKQVSKGAPTQITKATGKGLRDTDDDLEPHDVQTFRQTAGTGLSIDRPSHQFAMSVVMNGMSEPKMVHQFQVVRMARCTLHHRERVGCSTIKQTRRHCVCTRTRIGQRSFIHIL